MDWIKNNLLLVIIGGVIIIGGLWSVTWFNGTVSAEENVKGQWANVENVYQRRSDLIPNLVNTVKGYAEHEKSVFTEVTEARSKVGQVNIDPSKLTPESIKNFQAAQTGLTSALSKLMVVMERYPELKANANFSQLQAQLEGTENRISVERKKFNDMTIAFNKRIKKFPGSLFNKIFGGFEEAGYFEAEKGAENAPQVKF